MVWLNAIPAMQGMNGTMMKIWDILSVGCALQENSTIYLEKGNSHAEIVQ